MTSRGLQSLVPTPAAGFDEPFEMLQACHDRVQRTLDLLARLREHLLSHGADSQAQHAARDVMRYFDLAAPHHHRDEELHVFPPLLAGSDRGLQALVARLQHEHVQMEAHWNGARPVLAGIAEGRLARLDAAAEAKLDAFTAVHADHMAAEEQVAYPAARAMLDAGDLSSAGQEMRRRRGAG